MFVEDEDWSEDKAPGVQPCVQQLSLSVKKTKVGKKSLLRTLQMLGSVPQWSPEAPRASDSDGETPTQHAKKRKKRRKRRKHGDAEVEQEDEEQEDAPVTKRSKAADEVRSTTSDKLKDQEMSKPTDNSDTKLSRKQWRNRNKNKRKSKNKFKPNVASAEEESTAANANTNMTKDNRAVEKVKKKCRKDNGKVGEELIETQSKKEEIKKTKVAAVTRADTHGEFQKADNFEFTKKAQQKKEKLRRLLQSQETEEVEPEDQGPTVEDLEPLESLEPSASLRSRMKQRLDSARFRYINEVLYSSSSSEARRMFSQDQEAFWVYHRGYSAQVQRWPHNPVDLIIQFIKLKPASLVVADFGCGDCKIAKSVKNKVHSFDLVATCDLATTCDMAKVPLKDASVDIAIFCLSLMGTNLTDFLKEANRVLKKGGFLKIAEVSSRFENVRSFTTALASLGFKLVSKDTENTHFFSFDFVKTGLAPENAKKFGLQLKPCVYKKR